MHGKEHLEIFDGLPTKRKLQMLTDLGRLSETVHGKISDLKQYHTRRLIVENCRPYDPHLQLLDALKSKGFLLAVASNSIRTTIIDMLTRAEIIHYFDAITSNEDVVNPKPDPEMYLSTFQKLSIMATEALILEDSDHGLKAAYSSGAHVLKIGTIADVNCDNVRNRLIEIGADL